MYIGRQHHQYGGLSAEVCGNYKESCNLTLEKVILDDQMNFESKRDYLLAEFGTLDIDNVYCAFVDC